MNIRMIQLINISRNLNKRRLVLSLQIKVSGILPLARELDKNYNSPMKLLSLNVWGGTVYEELIDYIKTQSKDTDIFCFQEVFHSTQSKISNGIKTDLFDNLQKILPEFSGFYAPIITGYDTQIKVDFDLAFGQATFIRKNIDLISEETYFVHGEFDFAPPVIIEGITDGMDLPRNIHCIKIKIIDREVLIGNFHGYWMPGLKVDSMQSIAQMEAVLEIYNSFDGPRIIAGDFNLRPETKSITMLEENLKNLIKEYGIKSTRSSHYKKTTEKFADYVLVSDDIKIKSFKVPSETVSDHLPMILDFSV